MAGSNYVPRLTDARLEQLLAGVSAVLLAGHGPAVRPRRPGVMWPRLCGSIGRSRQAPSPPIPTRWWRRCRNPSSSTSGRTFPRCCRRSSAWWTRIRVPVASCVPARRVRTRSPGVGPQPVVSSGSPSGGCADVSSTGTSRPIRSSISHRLSSWMRSDVQRWTRSPSRCRKGSWRATP